MCRSLPSCRCDWRRVASQQRRVCNPGVPSSVKPAPESVERGHGWLCWRRCKCCMQCIFLITTCCAVHPSTCSDLCGTTQRQLFGWSKSRCVARLGRYAVHRQCWASFRTSQAISCESPRFMRGLEPALRGLCVMASTRWAKGGTGVNSLQ